MPFYEYYCQDCGQRVTIRRSICQTAPPRCPDCGGEKVTRLMSPVSIVKSERERIRDLSWVDKDLALRFKDKSR